MVTLQARRLETAQAEEANYVARQAADFQFLIVALSRLRVAVRLGQTVALAEADLRSALAVFDAAVPGLKRMRDVAEHINNYVIDSASRHDKSVDRHMLPSVAWDEGMYMWLGEQLDVGAAERAAADLLEALVKAQREVATSA